MGIASLGCRNIQRNRGYYISPPCYVTVCYGCYVTVTLLVSYDWTSRRTVTARTPSVTPGVLRRFHEQKNVASSSLLRLPFVWVCPVLRGVTLSAGPIERSQ